MVYTYIHLHSFSFSWVKYIDVLGVLQDKISFIYILFHTAYSLRLCKIKDLNKTKSIKVVRKFKDKI